MDDIICHTYTRCHESFPGEPKKFTEKKNIMINKHKDVLDLSQEVRNMINVIMLKVMCAM